MRRPQPLIRSVTGCKKDLARENQCNMERGRDFSVSGAPELLWKLLLAGSVQQFSKLHRQTVAGKLR